MLAEYALAGIDMPIGVSSYELTRALPVSLRSALPTVEEIEAELDEPKPEPKAGPAAGAPDGTPPRKPRRATAEKRPKRSANGK
jgi:hypothetical protein